MENLNTKIIIIENNEVKKEIHDLEKLVKKTYLKNINNSKELRIFGKGSLTSKLWRFYNVFNYDKPALNLLFNEIKKFFIEKYSPNESFIINSWINIHKQGEFLPWHSHWPINANSYHGYYCVNVEPSTTTYKFLNIKELFVNNNKNNMIVIGKSEGDMHCTSNWTQSEERISIAFDIVPKAIEIRSPDYFKAYSSSAFIDFITI